MESVNIPKPPQINFTGLEHRSDVERAEVRLQVIRALEEFGCFEVVCDDKLRPELREAFFGKAIKEPFGLPLETKLASNPSDRPFQGYIHSPGMDYESLIIHNCDDAESLHNFTKLMWGELEGNPSFRETVSKFLRGMKEIDDMVVKMVHESYGVERHFDSYLKNNVHSVRLARYGASPKPEEVVVGTHTDASMTTIVCQHDQEGLEIQLKDGSWTTPSQNSINYLLGDYILAWSNGRLQPSYHRVKKTGSVDRYSTVYSSTPGDEIQIETLKELVDSDHPLLFKPFYPQEYLGFRFSEAGMKSKCPLQAFCSTTTVDQPAAAAINAETATAG